VLFGIVGRSVHLSSSKLTKDQLARLPAAEFNPETSQTLCSRSESSALTLGRQPLSTSYGIFESCVQSGRPLQLIDVLRRRLLPDPTALETDQLETTMSIAVDETGTVALVRQLGIAKPEVLMSCWEKAEARIGVLRRLLDGGEE
jgi:exosome complex RNA-binding protein Rrp42 (RNase PH superfamily)